MREVEPRVLRVVDVPRASTLPELHNVLQAAIGWTDSHLHEFVADEASYGHPPTEDWETQRDEAGVRLTDLSDRFLYRYDFGDGWEHDVEVIGHGEEQPGCRYGEGRCPPEDVGGPGGYAELLAVLADPTHDEHDRMRAWAGELADFDLSASDLLVRQTVGAVPASVRLLLDLTACGVKLTPAGRLPRALVRQVQQHRPDWAWSDRPASIEEDLLPLADLHGAMRSVGLLRLSKGVLRPTRAAADDLQTVRRLRTWFAGDPFDHQLAALSVATLAARGPQRIERLAATVHELLGHGWMCDGRPLSKEDVRRSMASLAALLRGLDLVEVSHGTWSPGPSACWLLPRATALARHL